MLSVLNYLLYLRHWRMRSSFYKIHGRLPDYTQPTLYGEKMQWRKLFDRNPLFPLFLDKIAVREYVREKAPDLRMSEALWIGTDPDTIPFDDLPEQYVVKPTGHSGASYFVQSRDDAIPENIKAKCREWLSSPYPRKRKEWAYSKVRQQIMIEERIAGDSNMDAFRDMRFYVFDGQTRLIQAGAPYIKDNKRKSLPVHTFYDEHWQQMPYYKIKAQTKIAKAEPEPPMFSDMRDTANRLGRDLDHIRVDFYVLGEETYFSELTVYSGSGFSRIGLDRDCGMGTTETFDSYLGRHWSIPHIDFARKAYRGLLLG